MNRHSSPAFPTRALALVGLGCAVILAAFEFTRAFSLATLRSLLAGPGRWVAFELLVFLAVLAVGLLAGLAGLFRERLQPRFAGALERLAQAGRMRPWLRWAISIAIALIPSILVLHTQLGSYLPGRFLRLALLLAAGVLAGACMPLERESWTLAKAFAGGLILTGSLFAFAVQAAAITNYPFPLTWSEGNRIFEYSLFFGRSRYVNGNELAPLNQAEGRYMLWGLSFLIPNSPIWVHRLWNALLSTVPHLALGLLLARWGKLSRPGALAFGLWIFLFLGQGPIYTPLILSALIVVVFVRPNRLLLSLVAAAAAGYYAAISRWTWLPAVPTWAAFLWLARLELPQAAGWRSTLAAWAKKLWPAAVVALAGLAGGLLADPTLLNPQELSTSTTMAQPRLWYRLFPNATYAEGILGALLMACLPAMLLLVWLVISRRWKLGWVQQLAYGGAALLFLAAGTIISVKIGGGNNLHNLDMFLVTLAILAGLALAGISEPQAGAWPPAAKALLALAILLPAWNAVNSSGPLQFAAQDEVTRAIAILNRQTAAALPVGPILFMDQRQLLTFGQVKNVPVVLDYEKKWVMDQAMAGDRAYFEQFYRDLAAKRFALIITEPLFTTKKDGSYSFAEENNAWTHWVAEPLLCYYTPLRRIPGVDIQLLKPAENPQNCSPLGAP